LRLIICDSAFIGDLHSYDIQACGITFKKADNIKAFANKVQGGEFDVDALRDLSDAEVIGKLSALKGIGVWTAEIFLGGDSDTLAAIAGSIAEVAYEIPDWIRDKALSYLDTPLFDAVTRWEIFISNSR
jgi:hypothetical protein